MHTAIIKDLVQVQRVSDSLVLQRQQHLILECMQLGRLPLHSDCNCIDVNPSADRCMWFGLPAVVKCNRQGPMKTRLSPGCDRECL